MGSGVVQRGHMEILSICWSCSVGGIGRINCIQISCLRAGINPFRHNFSPKRVVTADQLSSLLLLNPSLYIIMVHPSIALVMINRLNSPDLSFPLLSNFFALVHTPNILAPAYISLSLPSTPVIIYILYATVLRME